jgi:hypothetical protein
MLAMADATGYVAASVPGLADRARVPIEDCVQALESFRQPDEWSRTKDFEGRRIIDIDGGWQLLNHAKYRAIQDAEYRREQSRLAMQKLRLERKLTVSNVSQVSAVNVGERRFTQAEAEEEATTEEEAASKEEKPSASKRDSARKRAAPSASISVETLVAEGVDKQCATDWLAVRKLKRQPLTMTALESTRAEAAKAGLSLAEAICRSAQNGWAGFKASWCQERPQGGYSGAPINRQQLLEQHNRSVTEEWLAEKRKALNEAT